MGMRNILLSGVAAVILMLGFVSPAHAGFNTPAPYKPGGTCSGSMVAGFPKVLSNQLGETQGRLELRYSSATGGTNCAILYDMASGSHQMSVTIRRADLSYSGSDSGMYSTYAGGVAVTGAASRCIYVSGFLRMGPYSVDQFRGAWGPVACG